ncbi:MAG TPA: Rrf2 family transcriptional regulator [Flavobacteriaceae bacterium]|nr:Rrf2 family transcriptional regulator [Flavobacteriaceae bacterium]
MVFSRACEYGIRATLYIAHQSLNKERATLKDIAAEIDSPVAFTAKILQKLTRENLISSTKGPTGGFTLDSTKMQNTKLLEVVEAIDGKELFTQCGLGLKECSETHPCPVHKEFKHIRDKLHNMFDSTSIYDLAVDLENKKTYLKR